MMTNVWFGLIKLAVVEGGTNLSKSAPNSALPQFESSDAVAAKVNTHSIISQPRLEIASVNV
jgi:hypothetical protein